MHKWRSFSNFIQILDDFAAINSHPEKATRQHFLCIIFCNSAALKSSLRTHKLLPLVSKTRAQHICTQSEVKSCLLGDTRRECISCTYQLMRQREAAGNVCEGTKCSVKAGRTCTYNFSTFTGIIKTLPHAPLAAGGKLHAPLFWPRFLAHDSAMP